MSGLGQKNVCLLCHTQTALCKQSHIIPKFMYKGMVDAKNRFYMESYDGSKVNKKILNNGFYDKYILCLNCENDKLGKLDRYADRIFYAEYVKKDGFAIDFKKNQEGIRYLHLKNVRYKELKLFFLSLLWRAHVSTQPFFKEISLNPQLAESLRLSIINEDPGRDYEMKVNIIGLQPNPNSFYKVIARPRTSNDNGLTFYSFLINGLVYNFFPGADNSCTKLIGEAYLKETNEIGVPMYDGVMAAKFLEAYIGKAFFEPRN